MKPLALVIPWFGRNLKGGAEQQAWQIATRISQRGHQVEVLTTCCRSFFDDWAIDHYEPGLSHETGLTIRRFPVDPRNVERFNQLNSKMLSLPRSSLKPGLSPLPEDEASIFYQENINSTELLNYLDSHRNDYEAFVFIPYLYGPILNGLPLVFDKAYLQPCLHDEVYAYLPKVEHIFRKARGLLFNSSGEAQLALRLYGPGIANKCRIVGEGVEIGESDEDGLDKTKKIEPGLNPFVLFLGRRDPGKNVDMLIRAYGMFKDRCPQSSLKLVLAGPGSISYEGSFDGIKDLGLVDEKTKEALLENCRALFQPSINESYSRVIMEAWLKKRPVSVHRRCLATRVAVEDAKGGWVVDAEYEWSKLFALIDGLDDDRLARYGKAGYSFARQFAVWDRVINRYERVFFSAKSDLNSGHKPKKISRICQLLPDLVYGDAISNYALYIRDYLRKMGYDSEIYALRAYDKRVSHEARLMRSNSIRKRDAILYHHSIGSDLTPTVIDHNGPKKRVVWNWLVWRLPSLFRPAILDIM